MKTTHYILSLLILLSSNLLSFSQKNDRVTFPVKGTIVDKSTEETVPFVSIFNESSRSWAIANEEGNYSLAVSKGDTLVFTAIGFLGKVIFIKDNSVYQIDTIRLESQLYDIEEVKVIGYRDYAAFQKAYLELELPKTSIDIVRENLNISGTLVAKDAAYNKQAQEKLNTGLGFSFPFGNSGNNDKILLEKLQREQAMQYAVDKKFNRKIVFDLTQLADKELTDFIGFCNFSLNYLYNANEYEILEKIMEKYRLYQISISNNG